MNEDVDAVLVLCAVDPRLRCVGSADVMFVVATSGSMDPYYMPQVIEFISNMTLTLPVDNDGQVRIGVMTYGLHPYIDIALGAFNLSSRIIAALSYLRYHGNRCASCSLVPVLKPAVAAHLAKF